MSTQGNKQNGENIFDKMTTEELENILKMDTPFISSQSDEEYILKVLEVIEKREKENPSDKYNTNIDKAWNSFKDNYKDLENFSDDLPSQNDYINKFGRKIREVRKIAAIFIVLILIAGSVSIASNVFNYNIWGAVANWGKETFNFSIPSSNWKVERELHKKLAEHGIEDAKIPKKIPSEYICVDTDFIETPKKQMFSAYYSFEDKEFSIDVQIVNDVTSLTYEKDENVEIYDKDNIRYYFMTNMGKWQAIWLYEDSYYCIKGDISKTELKKMIDSIGGT